MATVNRAMMVTFETGADLSDSFGELVKLNATGRVVKTDAVTDAAIGVLAQNIKETASGVEVSVAVLNGSSILKAKAGAAITRGHFLHPDATAGNNGKMASAGAAPSTDNDFIIGQAIEAATAEDQIISFVAMGFRV